MFILSITDYQEGHNNLIKFDSFEDAEKEMKKQFTSACSDSGMSDEELEENYCISSTKTMRSLVYDEYLTEWSIWEF